MRVVIQRVAEADLKIGGETISNIGQGLLILLGIELGDETKDADYLVGKIISMRIFNDDTGKMNISISDVKGQFLVVSQFTLHASTMKGNRPSFIQSARPDQAIPLYEYFCKHLKSSSGIEVKTGVFGADMKVKLVNDGPVTILMDSKNRE